RREFERLNLDENGISEYISAYCIKHVFKYSNKDAPAVEARDKLYRIFYYDCPPVSKKAHRPVTGKAIDFAKSELAKRQNGIHEALKKRRQVALRLGYLKDHREWIIKPKKMKELVAKKIKWEQLTDDDFKYDVKQKGVDSRISVDIASLAYKRQVDRIVLIAGDCDFVPASKLARREGIDFVLDPMGNPLDSELFEHIDGCHSVFYKMKHWKPRETNGQVKKQKSQKKP
ncbi:MAG: NYN domain-containing protein, partial [Verrucomicrobiota bacterium]